MHFVCAMWRDLLSVTVSVRCNGRFLLAEGAQVTQLFSKDSALLSRSAGARSQTYRQRLCWAVCCPYAAVQQYIGTMHAWLAAASLCL